MTKILLFIALLVASFASNAQVTNPSTFELREEGASQGRSRVFNCVGANITCTIASGIATVTVSGGGGGYSTIEDEGGALTARTTLNFTGAGVACSDTGSKTQCSISGGAGSANVVEVSVNLGSEGGLIYTTTVTGQAWVTASSVIACSAFATSADGLTVETVYASGVQPVVANRVAGTGFDLAVLSPNGATGVFRFHCTGA